MRVWRAGGAGLRLGLVAVTLLGAVLSPAAAGSSPAASAASADAAASTAAPVVNAARPALAPPAADLHEAGRSVYNARCYFCHGYSGDARTQAAAALQPPPRDFTRAPALNAAAIAATLRSGRPGTAMASFASLLSVAEIEAVAAFVEQEFVRAQAPNPAYQSAYHTAENGWPDHQRYAQADDFVLGRVAVDAPVAQLDPAQQRGLALYRSACVSCHEPRDGAALQWQARPMSYPRPGILPGGALAPTPDPSVAAAPSGAGRLQVDAVSSASIYARHEQAPHLRGLSARERRGERLYQANCAFCHAPDGSAQNWIGRFMEPPARDLRQLDASALARLPQTVRDGLPGRSMPAWRTVFSPAEIAAVTAYVRRAFVPAALLRPSGPRRDR
jgi:cytochrome c oxidase cbb3-type subunit 3